LNFLMDGLVGTYYLQQRLQRYRAFSPSKLGRLEMEPNRIKKDELDKKTVLAWILIFMYQIAFIVL
jgi:hypothetical protein